MAEFNIQNSKVEQIGDSGDNYQVKDNSGKAAYSQSGKVARNQGDNNKSQQKQPTPSIWLVIWNKFKALLRWIVAQETS